MPDPNEYQDESEWMKVCVPKMIEEGKEQDQAVAACMSMWKDKGKEKKKDMQTDFTFTELAASDLKAIDGLAAGKFTAMSGDEVEFKAEDLEAYVANTNAIIESTKTEGGEIVGLPIDKNAHDHAGGAGWIVGLELDKVRNVVRFLVSWTEEGIALIKANTRRFFSPSTDPQNKTILGGSLTNWPATRNNKGQILLRPIELSQQIKEIDMEKTLEDLVAEINTLKTAVAELTKPAPKAEETPGDVTPEMAEFIAGTEGAEELGRQAQEMAMRVVRDEKRKQHVKEFAARVVGGTPDKPFGIPVRSSAIVAALLSMPDKQREFMEGLIMKMYEGAIDFAEHGVNGSEFIQGKPVPAEFTDSIKMWVQSGKSAASWFSEVMPELGDAKDYNLKEFATPKEE